MDKQTLLLELNDNVNELIEQLSMFTNENFTRKLSENDWSPAEVAEHLLILEGFAIAALKGTTIESNRPSDSKVAIIKMAMEDTNTKRTAPDVVKPSGTKKDLPTTIKELKYGREKLVAAVQELDLSVACTAFKHPALGTLTRLEWIAFTIAHTKRHAGQLKNIRESFADSMAVK